MPLIFIGGACVDGVDGDADVKEVDEADEERRVQAFASWRTEV